MFTHFLITRFNVPWTNGVKVDETWLSERCKIFAEYCLSSVNKQTCTNFTWLIYIEKQSPDYLKDIFRNECKVNFKLIEVASFQEMIDRVPKDCVSSCKSESQYVITSRLDNDDAIGPEYIKRIQESFVPRHNYFVNFKLGLCYHTIKQYISKYQYTNSPFVSKIELKDKVITILAHDHSAITSNIQINSFNWLQIIHNQNISNSMRGKPLFINKAKQDYYWLSGLPTKATITLIELLTFKYNSFIISLKNYIKKVFNLL